MAKKKAKRTNNKVQYITQKTKDRTARIPLEPSDELGCSGGVSISCSIFNILDNTNSRIEAKMLVIKSVTIQIS